MTILRDDVDGDKLARSASGKLVRPLNAKTECPEPCGDRLCCPVADQCLDLERIIALWNGGDDADWHEYAYPAGALTGMKSTGWDFDLEISGTLTVNTVAVAPYVNPGTYDASTTLTSLIVKYRTVDASLDQAGVTALLGTELGPWYLLNYVDQDTPQGQQQCAAVWFAVSTVTGTWTGADGTSGDWNDSTVAANTGRTGWRGIPDSTAGLAALFGDPYFTFSPSNGAYLFGTSLLQYSHFSAGGGDNAVSGFLWTAASEILRKNIGQMEIPSSEYPLSLVRPNDTFEAFAAARQGGTWYNSSPSNSRSWITTASNVNASYSMTNDVTRTSVNASGSFTTISTEVFAATLTKVDDCTPAGSVSVLCPEVDLYGRADACGSEELLPVGFLKSTRPSDPNDTSYDVGDQRYTPSTGPWYEDDGGSWTTLECDEDEAAMVEATRCNTGDLNGWTPPAIYYFQPPDGADYTGQVLEVVFSVDVGGGITCQQTVWYEITNTENDGTNNDVVAETLAEGPCGSHTDSEGLCTDDIDGPDDGYWFDPCERYPPGDPRRPAWCPGV